MWRLETRRKDFLKCREEEEEEACMLCFIHGTICCIIEFMSWHISLRFTWGCYLRMHQRMHHIRELIRLQSEFVIFCESHTRAATVRRLTFLTRNPFLSAAGFLLPAQDGNIISQWCQCLFWDDMGCVHTANFSFYGSFVLFLSDGQFCSHDVPSNTQYQLFWHTLFKVTQHCSFLFPKLPDGYSLYPS